MVQMWALLEDLIEQYLKNPRNGTTSLWNRRWKYKLSVVVGSYVQIVNLGE